MSSCPSVRAFSAFALSVAALGAAEAEAGALNPWYGRLGDGDAAVTPYVYVMDGGSVDASVYVQSSFARHFDLLVGAGGSMVPNAEAGFSGVDLMPRFFFTDQLGLTLRTRLGADGTAAVGPEFHGVFARGAFTFAVNAGFADQAAYGLFAPEWSLNDRFSLFVELDPVLPVGGAPSLLTVPGVGLALDKNARHTCALGVQIPTLSPAPPSYGIWYSTAIGG